MAIKSKTQLVQCDTGTVTSVSASASSVTLKAKNVDRAGLIIYNDSSSACYVKFGAIASTSSFTYKMGAGDHLVIDAEAALYTGVVDAIWDSASGNARITELS